MLAGGQISEILNSPDRSRRRPVKKIGRCNPWLTSCARRCGTFKQKLQQVLFETTLVVRVLPTYDSLGLSSQNTPAMRENPPWFPVGRVDR